MRTINTIDTTDVSFQYMKAIFICSIIPHNLITICSIAFENVLYVQHCNDIVVIMIYFNVH